MKKTLLFAASMLIMLSVIAQNYGINPNIKADKAPIRNVDESILKGMPIVNAGHAFPKPSQGTKSSEIVTVIDIGGSANAYGLYNGGRTALWADDNTKAVAFFHRMLIPPGSGYLAYDYSINGGLVWSVNNQLYNPTIAPGANARYPQGVIYNPTGNTVPTNAFVSYFAPILDGSNGTPASWGGYGAGTRKIAELTGPAQQSWPTVGAFRQNVPSAMTINPVNGDIWVYEPSLIGGIGSGYTDSLLITKGVFSQATSNYTYTQSLMYAPRGVGGTASPADERIAFAPDGLTGYMSLLWDNGSDPFNAGKAFYPILYKTTNGGQTWTGPTPVVLSGPLGMPEIKNYLTADQWAAFWTNPGAVHRDSICYTTAFDHDLVVDANGNPHICVTIGVCGIHGTTPTAYSILGGSSGLCATFHIYSRNQGATWMAKYISHNKTFRGAFGAISEDNRSQITRTMDGKKVFLSWIDTDFPDVTTNTLPDIFCVGFDMLNTPNKYTPVYNVTLYSDAWTDATWGTASHYALTSGSDFIVPFAYQSLTAGSDVSPVQYKYIPDFKLTQANFTVLSTEEIPMMGQAFSVSQNFPNPFRGTTQFTLELNRPAKVSIEVYNLMGQRVMLNDMGTMNAKSHIITINLSNQPTGLYFYKITTDNQVITKKMIMQ
ncbi:MAG: T9SS type A sorting domain-containing protein [Bacteroidales bacterium]|nr:T9SS type A sorting domain-containing protein [Bacteroidales bacterium]MDZ4204425.1 T9SS type A sorting domain-containing protein [Bacteroidales bacterium]